MAQLDSPIESTTTLTSRLAAEGRAVETVFTAAADALFAGREDLVRLVATIQAYRTGLSRLSTDELIASSTAMTEQIATVEASFAEECRAIATMEQALRATKSPFSSLRQRVQTLQVFTSTVRVVEMEVGFDEGHSFSQQIKDQSTRSMEGLEELGRLARRIREQTAEISARQTAFTDTGGRSLSAMRGQLDAMVARIAPGVKKALEDGARTEDAARQASDRLGGAISALQVGDSFRQRIEHAGAALALLPDATEHRAAHAFLRHLVATQMTAAATALRRDIDRAADTMATVSAGTADLVAWSGELLESSEIAELLGTLQDVSGAGLARLYSAQAERRLLETQLRTLRDALGDIQKVTREQLEVDGLMRMGSYNVTLRSQSSRGKGTTMTYVAKQIGELTDQCLAARQDVMRHLDVVRRTIADNFHTSAGRVSGRLDSIADGMSGLGDMLRLWRDLHASLSDLRTAGPEAVAEFDRCAKQMRAQLATAQRLEDMADRLRIDPSVPQAFPADDPTAREIAAQIRALYSVPEEREIHDRLCAPGSSGAALPARAPAEGIAGGAPAEPGGAPAEEAEFEWF
ncbi:hypothetical protein [Salipiger mucosus]|uniref:Uncharacterized protein n=1 Tax=Salipiger mucosus DSM 16094 TaxID=1123237 RepID=S9QFK8_9RHOB|nr:hypothetical protein [Salipiger mucosus]EPX78657.1 hypothetical protein Salmuc_04238 [Salipiger mucosus DSM 16094]